MSDRTAEQAAADDAVARAIHQSMVAYGRLDDHEQVDRFVVVLSTVKADDPQYESYGMLYSSGSQPTYVTLGLLHVGLQITDPRYRAVVDDDDGD